MAHLLEKKLTEIQETLTRMQTQKKESQKRFYTNKFKITDEMTEEEKAVIKKNIDRRNELARARYRKNKETREEKINGMFGGNNPLENQKTGIFYMNTNNGKTIFEDGEEIDSVENRMVIFPASKRHAGTTHTDTICRCLINFNWF